MHTKSKCINITLILCFRLKSDFFVKANEVVIAVLSAEANCCLALPLRNECMWKHVYSVLGRTEMIHDLQMIQILFTLQRPIKMGQSAFSAEITVKLYLINCLQ